MIGSLLSSFFINKWTAGLAALAIILGGLYWYVTGQQERIESLIRENITIEQALNDSNEAVDQLEEAYREEQRQRSMLDQELSAARERNDELRERLADHDLGYLAESRPGLIENIINDASDDALRCFELLSGAPLTNEELNAETDRDFNSECPWLRSAISNSVR